MAFGSWTAYYYFKKKGIRDKLTGWYILIFGTLDLYAHIRFRAVKRYFQPLEHNVEIGAGGGG